MIHKKTLGFLAMSLMISGCGNEASSHTHTFEEAYTNDDIYHWHKATCEHTDEKDEYEIHSFGEWTVTKDATFTEKGQKERTCSICSYKQIVEIDKLIAYEKIDSKSLYFGRYPQILETNEAEISTLNKKAGDLPSAEDSKQWTDYGYYDSGKISTYMFYIDVDEDNDGTMDYRGVYFTSYRPLYTEGSSNVTTSNQRKNEYVVNQVYWFKYSYIKWNILKSDSNILTIISDSLLDSQDYNNSLETRTNVKDYQGNETSNDIYSNNYMYSSIRSWLNVTFYDTAFSTTQKEIIEKSTVDNSLSSTEETENNCICDDTNDNIYLLSKKEVNEFYANDDSRQAIGTDYAKAQGLYVSSNKTSGYLLRTPYYGKSEYSMMVYYHGGIDLDDCTSVGFGIRPVLDVKVID